MKTEPQLTAGEQAKVAWYMARMAKRNLAGDNVYQGDLIRKVDRIFDAAEKREKNGK
ncbi:hypothetical protein GCM10009730_42130 [Streptomyces albidochromogenes]|uniref:DUF6257 family protein n=1 Tax=Streptomyces albidochromogenes TaxID=329524 RepID=UPI00142EBF9A|nr:DUF6257 family protein [Streptomyces albidochromogenes]